MPKKSRLLICCEGETERQYVLSVVSALGIKNLPKILNPPASAPIGLLEAAYKEYCWSQAVDTVPFTEIWLVFDRDHHPTYTKVFELAPKIGPQIHLCWTNPCIEFWFWLHYSANLSELKFDDELEVSCEERTVLLDNRIKEVTRIQLVQQTIKPETMLTCLRKYCSDYTKVQCPHGLVKRSVQACEHLQQVAQSTDPMKMGSAMPELLLRLVRLAEEESAPAEAATVPAEELSMTEAKEVEAALASAFGPTIAPEVGPLAHVVPATQKIYRAQDSWNDCVAPLRKCLEDWKTIRMTTEGVVLTNPVLARIQQLLQLLKSVEAATNDDLNTAGAFGTLEAIRKNRKQLLKGDVIAKMRLQLRTLGDVLRISAGKLGLQNELVGLDLEMKTGAGLLPSAPATVPAPVVASVSAPTPEPVAVPEPTASEAQLVVTTPSEKPTEPGKETQIVEAATAETVEAPSAPEAKEEATPVSAPEVAISGTSLTLREELDLWKACAERLRTCIDDWKSIKVTLEGITFSDEALARLEEFFMALKAVEEATGTCSRSQICLETLEALKVNRALEVSPHLIAKMQKQFRALGTVMRATAKKVGWKKRDLVGIDFELTSGAGVSDEQAATVPLPELKFGSEPAPESKAAEEQPVASAPLEPAAESLPETTEEDELRSRLQELKSLQMDFERMMRFVVLHKGEPPQEKLPGLCEKAAGVHQNALAAVESCLELLAGMPVEKAEPASAPAP